MLHTHALNREVQSAYREEKDFSREHTKGDFIFRGVWVSFGLFDFRALEKVK